MIISLSVDKILAGKISTNKFTIVSDSGNMLISDNTIQIKDSSRVRVQIGKDASNDYNMYVWDSTGNLMFDATGLKASGIKSKIIRDDMVSDTANISGNKIEKESLVSQINGATTTLKASKIKFDDINQTLDIAFNSLKTTIYDTGQTVSSQGTSIGTLQGQISTKIWQTDITTSINNVVIGGRNLAQKTSDIYIDATGFTGATNDGRFPYTVLIRDLNVGDNVTVSFNFKYSNLTYNNTSRGMRIQGRGNVTGWGNGAFNSYSIPIDFNAGTGEINVSYRMIITADHLLNSFWDVNFRTDFITGGTISVKSLMIEKGNKKTTWTPALEDLDTKISENYSSINKTINGINTTVGSMQTSISGHETRINTAETSIGIMKDQILLKVEKTDIYNVAGLVTKIDDRDESLIYTGTWTRGNDPGHYNTTYSYSATANASVKLTFEGVGIRWVTSKNTARGYADVKIDGTIVATNLDTYSAAPTVTNFVAFEKLGLSYGQHTIEIIVRGTKRAEAASPAVLIDCFEVLKEAQTQIDSTVSSLSLLSNQITSKVSTTDFATYKIQTANQIASKVSAVDFGSLIEQNSNNVRVAVGQIGGTNLLKGTDFSGLVGSKTPQGWWYWGNAQTFSAQGQTNYNNAGTVYIQNSSTTTGGLWQNNIPLKPNTKYTLSLSVWKESVVKGGSFIFEFMDSNGINISNIEIALNFDNARHSYTFTTPSTFNSVQGGLLHQGSYNSGGGYLIYMSYPKLEEGENVTAWSPHHSELKNTTVTINDLGLTVRNGAISIRNNAGVEVLKGDTSGNLSIRGDFTNYDTTTGNAAIKITNRTIDFNDWDSNSICGTIFAGKLVGQNSTRGMSFGAKRNKYLDIAYEDINGNYAAAIRLDNGALGNAGTISLYKVSIESGEEIWIKNLYVSGTKNSIQETKTYGNRLINAYETAEYFFGDIGSGKIYSNGECYVYIDEIFKECVNTNIEYHVFTQVYEGSIKKIKRYENFFIVYGEAGTEFSWELKAKRKGFEYARLEQKYVGLNANIEDELNFRALSTDIEEELYRDLADELLEV